MGGKHFFKYIQKYHIFFAFAILIWFLYACNSTKKVPQGKYLLTKNNFEYIDNHLYKDVIPNYVSQKPNKKILYLFPVGLWLYNQSNPKYDSILREYMTFPGDMRNQNLRDSLFRKYNHPEYVGKSIFASRFFHTFGKPPVILEEGKTETSATSIRKYLVYKGFWDAKVDFSHKLDSASKKAEANYKITHKDPTYISSYSYNIPYENIKNIYEQKISESFVKSGTVLNQENLEEEVKRITNLMQERGFYSFNKDGGEIYFTADTLKSRKKVPLTMDILKDSIKTPYKQYTIGDIEIQYLEKITDKPQENAEYKDVNIKRIDDQYNLKALWRPITIKRGEVYNQKNLDLTKRNFLSLNNFNIASYEAGPKDDNNPNDTIINVRYKLIPLPKYNIKTAIDLHYSQILNFGFSPSAELTARNLFGGAENFTGSVSGTFGTVYDEKNPQAKFNASEYSLQLGLNFPRLLLPFRTENFVPNKYSPVTIFNIGASVQNNIGMDRTNLNGGLNYFLTVNDVISHRFSAFNTQFSFTRNKDRYYDYFDAERAIKDDIFSLYKQYNPNVDPNLSIEDFSKLVLNDGSFHSTLNADGQQLLLNFRQSVIKKDRLTQDVLINSFSYNFIYNEIGKKGYKNPFFFDAKIEFAGNMLSLFSKNNNETGIINASKTVFGIPISQFVKFDIDTRKYFTFNRNHQFIVRQFIGVGIPYGNSSDLPFIRSYFNGGSNDIRAWVAFGGLGPADTQIDKRVRAYMMDNVKLTSNIEYRFPISDMFEGAVFADAGNIWSLKDNGIGDEFKFNKFISQMGLGSGLGLRIKIAYIVARFDFAYKLHDPNLPKGERWVISSIQPLKPTFNFSIGYPF
mgnify:CR=1 FL=1